MDDRYEIVFYHGHRFDRMTVQALQAMEKRLGYELTILQGSYNGGVGASAGTHDGGGAVDLAPADAANKVRVGREVGFAIWERQPIPNLWPHHVHGILIGDAEASPSALRQVAQYRNHTNGLADFGSDNTWHPSPIAAYHYRHKPPVPTIQVDLSNLRVDFFNALEGKAGNSPKGRVKVVQRVMNKKMPDASPPLFVDGIVGEHTLDRWGRWEDKIGNRKGADPDKPRIPDPHSLRALLRGTIYFMVP